MPHCLKCNYKLTLLSHRRKYKCALCSKLYPQKEVELETFRKWNKLQRARDIENYAYALKRKKSQLQELKKSVKRLFKNSHVTSPRRYRKAYFANNREKILQYNRTWRAQHLDYDMKRKQEYYQKYKAKILAERKLQRQKNQEFYNKQARDLRHKNLQIVSAQNMTRYWRRKQKELALLYLKNEGYKPCNSGISPSVST